jgi:membrane-bound metal-dependent hydrolase YbcI (DUF457 family)
MKKFKIVDFWINIALLIISIIIPILWHHSGISGYFIVGAWQLISTFVHILSPTFTIGKARKIYHIMLIIVTSSILIALPFGAIISVLYSLLFVAPFMAIYYTVLCSEETFTKMKRPLDQLK